MSFIYSNHQLSNSIGLLSSPEAIVRPISSAMEAKHKALSAHVLAKYHLEEKTVRGASPPPPPQPAPSLLSTIDNARNETRARLLQLKRKFIEHKKQQQLEVQVQTMGFVPPPPPPPLVVVAAPVESKRMIIDSRIPPAPPLQSLSSPRTTRVPTERELVRRRNMVQTHADVMHELLVSAPDSKTRAIDPRIPPAPPMHRQQVSIIPPPPPPMIHRRQQVSSINVRSNLLDAIRERMQPMQEMKHYGAHRPMRQILPREHVKQDVTNLRDDQICILCFDDQRTHCFIPCGHFATCGPCAKKSAKRCPVCCKRDVTAYQIYIV